MHAAKENFLTCRIKTMKKQPSRGQVGDCLLPVLTRMAIINSYHLAVHSYMQLQLLPFSHNLHTTGPQQASPFPEVTDFTVVSMPGSVITDFMALISE